MKKIVVLLGVLLSLSGIFVTSGVQISLANEVESQTQSTESLDEVIVDRNLQINPLTAEEKEVIHSLNEISRKLNLMRASTMVRFQNGGVNFFYKTSAQKKQVRSLISSIRDAAIATGVATKLGKTLSIFLGAAGPVAIVNTVVTFLVGIGASALATKANIMIAKMGEHGNVGTIRATLTAVIYSSTYDKRW